MPTDDFDTRLREVFDQFDADRSGAIDVDELAQVMDTLGQACTDAELLVLKCMCAQLT